MFLLKHGSINIQSIVSVIRSVLSDGVVHRTQSTDDFPICGRVNILSVKMKTVPEKNEIFSHLLPVYHWRTNFHFS